MNFLPPQPIYKRFFYSFLSGILLLLSGLGVGILYAKKVAGERVSALEAEVAQKRKQLNQAIQLKKNEEKIYESQQPAMDYEKTIQEVEANQRRWKEAADQVHQMVPRGTDLFRLQGIGNQLDGWAYFSSISEATKFLQELVEKKPDLYQEAWIECVGDRCMNEVHKKNANQVLVHFRLDLKREKGVEESSENQSRSGDGSPESS
jgi:hypothetical protein